MLHTILYPHAKEGIILGLRHLPGLKRIKQLGDFLMRFEKRSTEAFKIQKKWFSNDVIAEPPPFEMISFFHNSTEEKKKSSNYAWWIMSFSTRWCTADVACHQPHLDDVEGEPKDTELNYPI